MRVTNAAALWHPDEKCPKPTGSSNNRWGPQVLQAIRTIAHSDSRSLGVRKLQLELESFVTRPGHPQRTTVAPAAEPASGRATSNHPSGEASFQQIKYTTALGAKQASSKAQPSQQQSRPPAKQSPNSKAGLRQSITAPAARPTSGKSTTAPAARPVSHLRFSLFSETRWVSVLRVSPTYSTASLRQHSQVNGGILGEPSDWTILDKHTTQTSRPHLLLSGFRVHIYCFPDFAFASTAFRILYPQTSRPHLLLFGLRIPIYCFSDFVSTFTAFRTSCQHLLHSGLRIPIYCFSDFVSTFTAFRTSRPHLLLFGFRVHIYCFSDLSTTFRTSRSHLPLFGLRVHIYCFPDFASPVTAFRTSRPQLLLSGLRVRIYCFSDFGRVGQDPSSQCATFQPSTWVREPPRTLSQSRGAASRCLPWWLLPLELLNWNILPFGYCGEAGSAICRSSTLPRDP
ncbi:hypothetical protein CRG98_012307 [Punica granatum]|uniref:Uncharacterized protein n=1 Tax=Punica granatum TaxID=22663 RepID=A0A2I0KG38_PUNGR|nr:hypothetical protein CRG98_012307 [Punica granatum]